MAIGYNNINRVRESVFDRLKGMGYTIEAYVHPRPASTAGSRSARAASSCPAPVIEPFVTVGANAMVWANVTLAHHCSVAEHCWIASGSVVSGQARVLRNTFVGVNATIVNAIRVAEYNIIGAAAMVSKDTKPNSVHLSRSAEPLRYSSDDYVKYFGV